MAKYPVVLALAALVTLAACDDADPTPPGNPPPGNVVLRYNVTGFGSYPADHVDTIRYLDAQGDTVEVAGASLPWSQTVSINPQTGPDEVYLRAWVVGPYSSVGLYLDISEGGQAITAQQRDGASSTQLVLNDLEVMTSRFGDD